MSSAESFESRPKSRAQQSVEDWLLLVGRGDIYRFGASKVDADGVGDDDQETDDQDGIVEVACSLNTQKTANSGGIRFEESGHAEIRVSTAKKKMRVENANIEVGQVWLLYSFLSPPAKHMMTTSSKKKLTVWRQTSVCRMATMDLMMFRAPQTASQKHQSGSRRVTDN